MELPRELPSASGRAEGALARRAIEVQIFAELMKISHFFCMLSIAGACIATSSRAHAAEDGPPSLFTYGVNGFWTGAQIGLATGYLATGREYESREWRTLVFGAGLGGIIGTGVGVTLAIVDADDPTPATGWLVLRDTGYGIGLGVLVGTATGALFLIDGGRAKNLVTGAAVGSLVGAAAGALVGVIQGQTMRRAPEAPVVPAANTGVSLRFGVTTSPDATALMPAVSGSF